MNDPASLLYIYKNHAIIHAIINKIVQRIGGGGIVFENQNGDEVEDRLTDEIRELFSGSGGNTSMLLEMREMVLAMLTVGDTYVELVQFNPRVRRLDVVSPKYMRKKTSDTGEVLQYIQWIQGRIVAEWMPEEMFSEGINNGDIYSTSPLEALMRELSIDLAQIVFNSKFFENDATPTTIIQLADNMEDYAQTPEEMSVLKKQLMDSYQGAMKSGKPAMSNLIKDVKVIQRDLDKLQFLESRDKFIEKACAVFNMSKVMIGLTDSANEATASLTMKQEFYQTAVRPYEDVLERFINDEILPALGYTYKVRILHQDYTDREQKIKVVMSERDGGLITTNEARARLDMEPILEAWADTYMIRTPQGLVPVEPLQVTDTEKGMLKGLNNILRR